MICCRSGWPRLHSRSPRVVVRLRARSVAVSVAVAGSPRARPAALRLRGPARCRRAAPLAACSSAAGGAAPASATATATVGTPPTARPHRPSRRTRVADDVRRGRRVVVLDPGHNGGNAGAPRGDQPPGAGRPRRHQGVQHHRAPSTDAGYAEHAFTFDVALRVREAADRQRRPRGADPHRRRRRRPVRRRARPRRGAGRCRRRGLHPRRRRGPVRRAGFHVAYSDPPLNAAQGGPARGAGRGPARRACAAPASPARPTSAATACRRATTWPG